jgi:hypothetical protein
MAMKKAANEQNAGEKEQKNYKHGMMKNEVADGNKSNFKQNMKEEAEQIDELSKKTMGSYIKKASHDVATKSAATGRYADRANTVKDQMKKGDYSNYQQGKKDDATADKMFNKSWKRREGIAKATDKLTKESVDEAAPAKMNVAADMDARKSEVQRKIAQKQAAHQQAKANRRISGTMKEAGGKCSCGEDNGSKMKCEVHGGPRNRQMVKGGKEQIVVNPPLKEAGELPKKVVTKGHEIAKSLIKHRAKVREPYAVGMATAKKSAGIKEDADQVDEVSKDLLKKAAGKAEKDYADRAKKGGDIYTDKQMKKRNDQSWKFRIAASQKD